MRKILILLFIIAFILLRLEACENKAQAKNSHEGILHKRKTLKTGWIDRGFPFHFQSLKKNVELLPGKVYLEGWHLLEC